MKNTNNEPAVMCYQRSVGIQELSVLVYFEKYNTDLYLSQTLQTP